MNQCYLCEFKSNKKSDPKAVGVTFVFSMSRFYIYLLLRLKARFKHYDGKYINQKFVACNL